MVQPDSFTFAGVDMLGQYGIRAVSTDVLLPRLRPRLLTIPGRDGSYDFGAGRYEDRTIQIDCDSRRALTRHELRELALLLSQKARLVLWDEPDKAYLARLYDDTPLRYIGRVGHEFTLVFQCAPFALGTAQTRAPAQGRLTYEGTAQTPTRLTITNQSPTTIHGLRLLITRRIP